MSITQFDPDFWLTSLHRSMTTYIGSKIDEYIIQPFPTPAGLQVYELVFDFPDAVELAKSSELEKTIIHFAVDDINNKKIGLGDDTTHRVETFDPGPGPDYAVYYEGKCHEVNYDIGVWASDKSGGITARMVVYEMLQKILGSEIGRTDFRNQTDVEILRFNGGRNIIDRINDVRVYRIIDCELVVRVYSRLMTTPAVIVDQEPIVDENLEIDGTPIS